MDEKPVRYIDPVNRNVDIVLGVLAIILIGAFILLYNAFLQNEETKQAFNISDIVNEKWESEFNNTSLMITEDKLSLTIKDEEIVKNVDYTFNSKTGEFVYTVNGKEVSEKLYLRSIGNNAITIWYDYAEYYLDKAK